jgi:hypothetical protein
MDALITWFLERKKRVVCVVLAITCATFFLPHQYDSFAMVWRGLLWHALSSETASLFWMGMGLSPALSQLITITIGMITSWGLCIGGLYMKEFLEYDRIHIYLASHPWVAKLPYLGIVILGIILPVGGVILGILITRKVGLPKFPATLTILATNLIKLCGWGRGMALLFPHFHPFTHLLNSLTR